MYEAPVSKILVGLADAANSSTTSSTTTEEVLDGFIGDCF